MPTSLGFRSKKGQQLGFKMKNCKIFQSQARIKAILHQGVFLHLAVRLLHVQLVCHCCITSKIQEKMLVHPLL